MCKQTQNAPARLLVWVQLSNHLEISTLLYKNMLMMLNISKNPRKAPVNCLQIINFKKIERKKWLLRIFTIKKSWPLDKAMQITLIKFQRWLTMHKKEFRSFIKFFRTRRGKLYKMNWGKLNKNSEWSKFRESLRTNCFRKESKSIPRYKVWTSTFTNLTPNKHKSWRRFLISCVLCICSIL